MGTTMDTGVVAHILKPKEESSLSFPTNQFFFHYRTEDCALLNAINTSPPPTITTAITDLYGKKCMQLMDPNLPRPGINYPCITVILNSKRVPILLYPCISKFLIL